MLPALGEARSDCSPGPMNSVSAAPVEVHVSGEPSASALVAGGLRPWSAPAAAAAQDDRPAEATPTAPGTTASDRLYRLEFGVYGGGHFFAKKHGLRQFDDDPEELSRPSDGGAFGARLTFNLNQHVAFEGDGWWTPTRTRDIYTPAVGVRLPRLAAARLWWAAARSACSCSSGPGA